MSFHQASELHAVVKPLTAADRAAARQSVEGLSAALAERFGHLPDMRVFPWIGDIHLHRLGGYARLDSTYTGHVDTGRQPGDFRFMEPEPFASSLLCSPRYWR